MRYTLAVTSCNRFDLLKRTLDSFLAFADVLPVATIIVDDSDKPQPAWLNDRKYNALGHLRQWKSNGQRRGQYFTLDKLYSSLPADVPYVFHLEDDWQFTKGNFIRPSFEILNKHPHIWTVSLRGTDCNGHPVVREKDIPINQPYWEGGWGGCHFNPGLRRLMDYERIESYGRITGYGQHGCAGELDLSRWHLDRNYRIAVLGPDPIIKHIGDHSRAIEPLPAAPRVLLAVPATFKYDYADKTYGIKRPETGRIEAVRETWFQDVKKFPNVTAKFFYGCVPDEPRADFNPADSILLNCPDDYLGLPHKTKAICEYAIINGFDFLVKADDDSIIYLDRLLRSGFDTVNQMGWKCQCKPVNGEYKCKCYAVGMCYTLSRHAMQLVAGTAIPKETWAEDLHVGTLLKASGIQYTRNENWVPGMGQHFVTFPLPRNTVAAHSVRPEDMRKWYKARAI